MAKRDGFCAHCGSLIQVDDAKEKIVCIFCKGETDTKKALELNNDAEARLLLQKATEQKAKEETIAQREKDKSGKKMEAYTPSKAPKQEIVLKPLPVKVKLIILGVFVTFALIVAAILTPLLITRNARRVTMDALIKDKIGITASSMAYKFNDNRELLVATTSTIDKETATAAFEQYVSIYAGAYDATTEKVRGKITVTIYDAAGRYICRYLNGATNVAFETATPIKTPTPEETITQSK